MRWTSSWAVVGCPGFELGGGAAGGGEWWWGCGYRVVLTRYFGKCDYSDNVSVNVIAGPTVCVSTSDAPACSRT